MRSLSRDARHERRVQVIRLRKARYTYEEIATQTGLSRTGVFDICKRHAAAGAPALRDAPSGRETGEGRLLEVGQEALVRKLIADKTPDQLKMPYALWTRAAVAQLIEQRFGIRLAIRTMGLYLARWGFTPQTVIQDAPICIGDWCPQNYGRSYSGSVTLTVPGAIGAFRRDVLVEVGKRIFYFGSGRDEVVVRAADLTFPSDVAFESGGAE